MRFTLFGTCVWWNQPNMIRMHTIITYGVQYNKQCFGESQPWRSRQGGELLLFVIMHACDGVSPLMFGR
jgi:hypothetical protein